MREEALVNTCRICEKNNATHMCEDCGAVLCLDCLESRTTDYFVCNECHEVLGTPLPGEKFEECAECGSEGIGQGRRIIEVCPKCHSSNTVSIEDKRRSLAQELRKSVMSIQYGHTRLREFYSRLTSAKRTLVSLRMASFLHYKWLEDKIERLEAEIPAIKNRIGKQAEMVAKQMAAESGGLMDYNQWTSGEFPFIEGVKNRLRVLGEQYKRSVDESIGELQPTLDDVIKQLEGLKYYRKEFSSFYDLAELSVNELPVCAFPDIKVTGSDMLKSDKAEGSLYITNKRMVFIAETGLVRKKMEVIFDFPLVYLKSIGEEGRIRKRVVLKLKHGEVKISCDEQTEKILPDYIEIAKKFDRYMQKDLQRVRKLEQSDVSISDVRLKIEELVYHLMSGERHTQQATRQPRTRYQMDPTQVCGYRGRDYEKPRGHTSFRDHLERTVDRVDRSYRTGSNRDSYASEISRLRRNMEDIENAMRNAVQMMRNGMMVTEDFIRRYKGLARDTYQARRRLAELDSDLRRPRW